MHTCTGVVAPAAMQPAVIAGLSCPPEECAVMYTMHVMAMPKVKATQKLVTKESAHIPPTRSSETQSQHTNLAHREALYGSLNEYFGVKS